MSLDSIIFIGFLLFNLAIGLFYSRGIQNIHDYAIGNRSFSAGTIAATIAATWIGGGVLSQTITETYKQGLYFIIPALGDSLVLLVIGYFFAPRMAEFLGKLSVAEAMGNLFGSQVKLIAGIIGVISCIGAVAVQFRVSATILQLFFDLSTFYAVLAGALVVILYSAVGGIKAVTFTDVIQIFTFAVIIPVISLIIWGTLKGPEEVFYGLSQNPNFDFKEVFNIYNYKFLDSILLFLFFIIPTFEPAVFQRISMAKDTIQIRHSFALATLICLGISLTIAWIGVLLLAKNPNLDPNSLLTHLVDNYSNYPGLKGIIAIGIMAVVMSTADSYINSGAILLTNDICKSLNMKWVTNHGLLLSRIFSIVVGAGAFVLAFNSQSILELTFLIWGSYMPIITAPLVLAIFGFRSTNKPTLIGMGAGLLTMVMFKVFDIPIKSVIPAMIMNILCLMLSHYILKQPGGWTGIKDPRPLKIVREQRKRSLREIVRNIKNFNLWSFFESNAPAKDYIYSLLGLFSLISVFSTMYSIPKEILQEHKQILQILYDTILLFSVIFLTFPIWPPTFRKRSFIIVAWNFLLPYILIFAPIILIIISNFGQFQLMIFLLNIIIISLMIRWQVAITMICLTATLSIYFYKWYLGVEYIGAAINGGLQFKIMYTLLLVSSVLVAFLKPKQEQHELAEEKNEHLSNRIGSQEKQLKEALGLRSEFIRNVNHEYHAPMTGITSVAEILDEAYDKLTEEQRRESIKIILNSSRRLDIFDSNLSSLSKLSKAGYELDLERINFSDLLHERVNVCRRLYDEGKNMCNFDINIEDDTVIDGDKKYLIQLLDNLIINAIAYCKEGKITINLEQFRGLLHLSIADEGIGIPTDELENIFDEFIVSSKTRTPAGNRGVGLALCKRVVEIHNGSIKAESDGVKGAIFKLTLPL